MSVIRKKPYIETVLESLSSQNKSDLKALLNNSSTEPVFASVYNLPQNGVRYVNFQLENIVNITGSTVPGIIIKNNSHCVLLQYLQSKEEFYNILPKSQEIKIYKIDATNHNWSVVEEYLTIAELRSILNDSAGGGEVTPAAILENMTGDIGVSVDLDETNQKVVVSLDLTGAEAGEYLKVNSSADGVEFEPMTLTKSVINNAGGLVIPTTTPTDIQLAGVDTGNTQVMVNLGTGLNYEGSTSPYTANVYGVVCPGITGALKFEKVSALPATPDANTLYIIVE